VSGQIWNRVATLWISIIMKKNQVVQSVASMIESLVAAVSKIEVCGQ
jgi:hypothetical protein